MLSFDEWNKEIDICRQRMHELDRSSTYRKLKLQMGNQSFNEDELRTVIDNDVEYNTLIYSYDQWQCRMRFIMKYGELPT